MDSWLDWLLEEQMLSEGCPNVRLEKGGAGMKARTTDELVAKKCRPCEGGVEPFSLEDAEAQLERLSGWRLTHDGKRIRRDWRVKDFMTAVDFLTRVAEIAESDGHHPDVHIEEYRNVWIELWTHAIGGLSENDFIVAAKIDRLAGDLSI